MTQIPAELNALLKGGPKAPVADPYTIYARLRRESPVLALPGRDRPTFLVTRYDDVRAVLRDDVLFSNRGNARGASLVMGRTIIEMDGAEHLLHRKLITPALAPRALRGDFPKLVAGLAHAIIDDFPADEVDLVAAFTFLYPLRVFVEILGLPPEDVATFHDWAADLALVIADPPKAFEASRKMHAVLLPLVEQKRKDPGEDLISALAIAEVEGTRLSDEEVVSFLRLLVSAGAETTFHLMGSALHVLLDDAALLARVRGDRDLLEPLLWETLRWEPSVSVLPRDATADTELAGVAIPEGSELMLMLGSANRDEAHYPDPDRFDIERDSTDTLAFGLGKHYCAGSRLALLEGQIGLGALLDRMDPLELVRGERSQILGFAFRGPDRLPVRSTATRRE